MTKDDAETPETEVANETAAEATEADVNTETDPVEALVNENAELKDRLLRTIAEMENLRKRTGREISDARTYAIANFARDMLTATDNLNRALMTLSADAREGADSAMQSLIDGIEMTEREMQRLMQKNGVRQIEAEGQKFDPHKHQAMFEIPNTEVPEGTVVQVMQDGFEIGDRVLRPAMVGVSKGGPKAGAAKPAAEAPEDIPADSAEGEGVHIDRQA